MALPHQSIATISSPEFINLKPLDINPLMSACDIKVLYLGENRNRSYISKETAIEMSKTLRGAPIVGYYREQKQDFSDHGQQVVLDGDGIHFNCLTKPYGFVAPDAKVWFQDFDDTDEFGNHIIRTYLMTTGFLWTGQFEEVKSVLNTGKPQSMELDEETLNGHWATNVKDNIELFIINDAIFTKLCILGDDTEPCFEGASVTEPDISRNFSYNINENFKKTLFSMINDLKDALKGGQNMDREVNSTVEEVATTFQQATVESSEPVVESTFESSAESVNESNVQTQPEASFENEENVQSEEVSETFEKKEDETENTQEEDNTDDTTDTEDEEEERKYSLLEQQYNELQTQFNELTNKYNALVEFKNQIENEQKDALINEFYMLSEQDKKDVIENKSKYTLEEIKAKLAVICYEKKVNFNSENSEKIDNNIEEQEIVTFTLNDNNNLPDWVKAVKNYQENN